MTNAVLIDITSIQNYVFGSNNLKENIGASAIVEEVLSEKFLKELINSDGSVAYSGGGNAMLFFRDGIKAIEFTKKYSLKLLTEFPGLVPAFAVDKFNELDFQTSKDKLFRKLSENKSGISPQVIPLSHGFSADCSKSGYAMNEWDNMGKEFVSNVIKKKLSFTEAGNNKVKSFLPGDKESKYCFTENFGELGSTENTNSHIAVVVADGNSMGDRFKATKSLEDTKALSDFLKEATSNAFKNLISKIISEFNDIEKTVSITKKPGKKVLPIRPIFIGGDDIVFVCDGRLGIYFAKIFLEEFAAINKDKYGLDASAGVAIAGLKYPFFRVHHLAESLCKNAKCKRKGKKDNGSWIDYQILYGGFSGSLNDMRKKQFMFNGNNLMMRPYKLIDDKSEISFEYLLQNTSRLYEKDKTGKYKIPKSKLKELREVFTKSEESLKMFINEFEARNYKLPEISGKNFHKQIFQDRVTPYFDMLELYEFYPSYKLSTKKGEGI